MPPFYQKTENMTTQVLEKMKSNLKIATNLKLKMERQIFKLRNTERSLSEELYSTKSEIEHLTEQLEDLKDQIYETCYNISRIEMVRSSETFKIESRINYMNNHKKAFDEMLEKEQSLLQLRNMEIKQRELEEEELQRKKIMKILEQNELHAKKVTVVEEESTAIERECVILRRRNNAIMLKLRRKLIETEVARKELLKKCEASPNL